MQLIDFPFRVVGGRVAKVTDGTDTADGLRLKMLLLTRPGERPLDPGFGLTDPTFRGVDPAEVAAGVAAYGPSVTILDVASQPSLAGGAPTGFVDVTVSYRPELSGEQREDLAFVVPTTGQA